MKSNFSIDKESYPLGETNYFKQVFHKNQIMLCHSFSTNMNHYVGWVNRINGHNKKTAPFTIDVDGNIYQHYDPKFYSSHTGDSEMDKVLIPILLENEGWLVKDINNEDYLNSVNHIYKRKDEVVTRKWRGFQYWAPYTEEQMKSAVELIKHLCSEFDIPRQTIGHNTKTNLIYDYEGVSFKSNFGKRFTDLSPAWDFTKFKNNIELN